MCINVLLMEVFNAAVEQIDYKCNLRDFLLLLLYMVQVSVCCTCRACISTCVCINY